MKKPQLLTSAQVADLLRVSKRTVHRRARKGQIPIATDDTTGMHFDKAKIDALVAGES